MMQETEQYSFRTKTGTCRITPTQIVLTREGILGAVAEGLYGKSILRALLIYAVLGVLAVVSSVLLFGRGDYVSGGLYAAIGLILLVSVLRSRDKSAAPIIERAAIRSVEVRPPRPPLTRGYFVVRFLEDGKNRRRLIMLPGSQSGGQVEYGIALIAMQQSGLIAGDSRTT